MQRNEAGVLEPTQAAEDFIKQFPTIREIAEITFISLFQLDSSDINPRHWKIIAETIVEHYETFDGFVILHGTDTMAYTATALSFMLNNLGKPVILTGSQLPITDVGTDGLRNFINAVRLACGDLAEVAIVFGDVVLRGNRSKKMHEFSFNSFISPNYPPLAELGVELRLSKQRFRRHTKPLELKNNLVTEISLIHLFPGITNQLVLDMITPRTKGIVIAGYGSGNIPLGEEGIEKAVEAILDQDITVAIDTQCVFGGVNYGRYVGGAFAKERGALTTHDMTSECSIIKLMWALGQTDQQTEIEKLYLTNIIGELTPKH